MFVWPAGRMKRGWSLSTTWWLVILTTWASQTTTPTLAPIPQFRMFFLYASSYQTWLNSLHISKQY